MASINPAFRRHPEEAALIGRIVVHFGELEFTLCRNAENTLAMYVPLTKALYSLRATSSRIDFVDGLIRNVYLIYGLGKEYDLAISMVRNCLRIRDLYAHCNWADDFSGNYPGLMPIYKMPQKLPTCAWTTNTSMSLYFRDKRTTLLKHWNDSLLLTMKWRSNSNG